MQSKFMHREERVGAQSTHSEGDCHCGPVRYFAVFAAQDANM